MVPMLSGACVASILFVSVRSRSEREVHVRSKRARVSREQDRQRVRQAQGKVGIQNSRPRASQVVQIEGIFSKGTCKITKDR